MRSKLVVLLSLILLFSLTACNNEADNSSNGADQAIENGIVSGEASGTAETIEATVSSQADMQGVISNITLNQITLDLIEPRVILGSTLFNNIENLPEGIDPKYLRETLGASSIPDGFDSENMPESSAEQVLLVTYTGETVSIAIPASLPILSGSDTISVTSLLPNHVMSIWYGEDGETIVLAVVQGIALR
jgi:hypothetical protein